MTRRAPWGLLVLAALFFVPAAGSRYYTFLANDVVIWALFATSLNLLPCWVHGSLETERPNEDA